MVELPSWFLIVVGVAVFAAAHRRRPETAFIYDGAEFKEPPFPYAQGRGQARHGRAGPRAARGPCRS